MDGWMDGWMGGGWVRTYEVRGMPHKDEHTHMYMHIYVQVNTNVVYIVHVRTAAPPRNTAVAPL